MILSFLALAFARPIGHVVADLRGVGEGEWDPKWKSCAKGWSIGTAVVAFYGEFCSVRFARFSSLIFLL